MKQRLIAFFALPFFLTSAIAQKQLNGLVKSGAEILTGTTIENITKHQINVSDLGGNYKIDAEIGDSVIFSHQGYQSDTIIADEYNLNKRLLVDMEIKITYLNRVDVSEMSAYTRDSLERKEDYDYIFKKTNNKKLWDNKLSGNGEGVNFSPIGHFSTEEKQKRELKKRLEQDDKDEFIYLKFTRRVPRLTGLTGDSLIMFTSRFKPSYDYCLHATSVDMLIYINDKYVLFKKGNKPKGKKK